MIKLSKDRMEFMGRPLASNSVGDYFMLSDGKHVAALFVAGASESFLSRITYLSENLPAITKEQGLYNILYERCNLPLSSISHEERKGIILPIYPEKFYFHDGQFKGAIMEGKWFCSEKLRNKFLDANLRGDWFSLMTAIKQLAAVVSILHRYGLTLCDLSYRTLLISPNDGSIYLISWDSIGRTNIDYIDICPTPDFEAPEHIVDYGTVRDVATVQSNLHSLAVLNYMLLFHRHPLRGKKINDANDPCLDEQLTLGENALFIEHPTDKSNNIEEENLLKSELPYGNPSLRPYTLSGKYFSNLFEESFVDGLHNPNKRPTSIEWFEAADKSIGLLMPCSNPDCEEKWFPYNNESNPVCPFCGAPINRTYPILNFYSCVKDSKYVSDGIRLVASDRKSLSKRHVYNVSSSNHLSDFLSEESYCEFVTQGDCCYLINNKLERLYVIESDNKRKIDVGDRVELKENMKLILDNLSGGRLILVQMLKPNHTHGKM